MQNAILKVLLVEDDRGDYILTRDLLNDIEAGEGQAFALDWVANYDEATHLIARGEHDVYLVDYRLGARDGIELLREAFQSSGKGPAIFLTGQSDREVDKMAMHAGASDYLVKGQIDAALLSRSIRYAIERRRASVELQKAHNELELRVAWRTAQLAQTNQELREAIETRRQTAAALQESQEYFRLLVESAHDYAMFLMDTTGCVTTWSSGAELIFGYSEAEVRDRPCDFIFTPEDRKEGVPAIEMATAAAQGRAEDTRWHIRKDGSRFYSDGVMVRLQDTTGNQRGFAVVMRDITQRKQAEEALQRAKEEAESANRAKNEFLSRTSHELRTPMNAILGFSQLLEIEELNPSQKESVQHILKAGWHLLSLINEVLDIARMEEGHMLLMPEPVPIREALSEAIDLVRPLAAQRNIRLSLATDALTSQSDDQCLRNVLADRQRLQQVLLNLLSNAIKYNHPGGEVRVTYTAFEENRVRIGVSDTGIGIAPEKMGQLFTPFDRLGAEKTGVKGVGLGLALCKNLTEAMQGHIEIQSTVGGGSTVWIDFPLASSLEKDETIPVLVSPRLAGTSTETDGLLLYIEDNLPNLIFIQRLLSHRPGIRVLSATRGRHGLELAQRHRPHLILMDSHLPDISTAEMLGGLREDGTSRPIPIVLLNADAKSSHSDMLAEPVPFLQASISDEPSVICLSQPLDIKQLWRVLDEVLRVS